MPNRPRLVLLVLAVTAALVAAGATGSASADAPSSASPPSASPPSASPSSASPSSASPTAAGDAVRPERLTNLAHLDFLGDSVRPPTQARHTTYRLADRPTIGVLWTYADRSDDGSYRRVGGGAYDPATDTYGQGAFNADDLTRAAVVYLRDWRQTRSRASRDHAAELLRAVTYLQTTSGPDAGNVVLWMQPDGTLNPSADPAEQPDPSDSDDSYWVARTVWALGEGYEAFRSTDPAFAAFLRRRLELAIDAIERDVLKDYGSYQVVDGRRTPRWLIVDGADASAEALLGLAAYIRAGGSPAARRALDQLAEGVAQLSDGDRTTWPFGAAMPWALSRSDWHAWGGQMPAGLAQASSVTRSRSVARTASAGAVRDSATFTPWLLTTEGPDNGLLPTPLEKVQIAYGADSRVQSLVATAKATNRKGFRDQAGIAAGWFFGANASGAPTYDLDTGVTFDGVEADGRVNANSGAESTIHGLLTMLALDADPRMRRLATSGASFTRSATTLLQAEEAQLAGGATSVVPESTWTGESKFGGTGYAALPNGSSVTFSVAAASTTDGSDGQRLVMPVVDLQRGSTAVTTFRSGGKVLGVVRSGHVGESGASAGPGWLKPVTLRRTVPLGAVTVTATTTATGGDVARLDALWMQPEVTSLVQSSGDAAAALVRSAAARPTWTQVQLPGSGRASVDVHDARGRRQRHAPSSSGAAGLRVRVLPGGFTIVSR